MPQQDDPPTAPMDGEDEEDYMSMAIVEPTQPKEKETYTQRRIRKQRESEIKGRPKSKKALEADATAARDAALSTALPTESKGFQMMAKLGFKAGSALGAATNPNARLEPLGVEFKEGRSGIGLDSEKKRKWREEVEGKVRRVKAEEGDYRERFAREREEARLEGLVGAAMRVAERMDDEEVGEREVVLDETKKAEEHRGTIGGTTRKTPRTKQVNLLWRGLVRQRETKERERRMRYDLHQSLSRNQNYDDPAEDKQDRQAWGNEEEEIEEEDPELDEFIALQPEERLRQLVEYLRKTFHYCFWCKFRYPDEEMDGCPGLTEDDHD